jgi:ATP/maltotriose-dependent transcriptional regulator MalT
VKLVASTYFAKGRWQKLSAWLSSLPQQAIAQDPELLLLGAQVQLRLGNPTNSLAQLDHLITGAHASNQMVLAQALVAQSAAYRRLGHLDLAMQAASEGLSILKEAGSPQEQVAEAHKQLGDVFSPGANTIKPRSIYKRLWNAPARRTCACFPWSTMTWG